KPFVSFFLVGEQLLDARALLHREEIKHQTFTSRFSCFVFRSSRTGIFEFNSTTSSSRSPRRRAGRAAWPRRFADGRGRLGRSQCQAPDGRSRFKSSRNEGRLTRALSRSGLLQAGREPWQCCCRRRNKFEKL